MSILSCGAEGVLYWTQMPAKHQSAACEHLRFCASTRVIIGDSRGIGISSLTSDAVVVSPANEDKETTQSNKREAIGAKEEASRAFQGRNLGRRRQSNWIAFEQMRLNEPCE